MALASTYFIKGQIPGVERERLLEIYKREILIQGAGSANIRDNVVEFSGGSSLFSRYGNKFAGFTNGRLIVDETEAEFEVYLEAKWPKWKFFFDVYFTTLRNDIERELQAK
jgi:hypothetical protein